MEGKALRITLSDVYFCPQFTNHIFSTNYFLSKARTNAVLLSAQSQVLRTSVCDIALHAEHKLVWLSASKAVAIGDCAETEPPEADILFNRTMVS